MSFTKGQTIVHPHHGPAIVRKVTTRTVRGEARDYYDLEVIESDLRVSVPVDQADDTGLRPIITRDDIDALLDVVRAPSEPEVKVWSRRMKENRDRLRTGDIFTHAAIMRDLSRRDQEKPLSFAERQMLRETREPIRVEMALALGITPDEAAEMLHAAKMEGVAVAA